MQSDIKWINEQGCMESLTSKQDVIFSEARKNVTDHVIVHVPRRDGKTSALAMLCVARIRRDCDKSTHQLVFTRTNPTAHGFIGVFAHIAAAYGFATKTGHDEFTLKINSKEYIGITHTVHIVRANMRKSARGIQADNIYLDDVSPLEEAVAPVLIPLLEWKDVHVMCAMTPTSDSDALEESMKKRAASGIDQPVYRIVEV